MHSGIFTGLFVLSAIMLLLLVFRFGNRAFACYTLLFTGVMLVNFGFMQIGNARGPEEALLANQTLCLAMSYLPFFWLMCLVDFCRVRIKGIYQIAFLLYGSLLFAQALSRKTAPWHYAGAGLGASGGAWRGGCEPLFLMGLLYLAVTFGMGVFLSLWSFWRRKDVSRVTAAALFGCHMFILAVFAAEWGRNPCGELLPVGCTAVQFIVLLLLRRDRLYDPAFLFSDFMAENAAGGFVVWDSNGRYLGADEVSKAWFPELSKLHVDGKLLDEDTEFLRQMGKWIRREAEEEAVCLESGGRVITARHMVRKGPGGGKIHGIWLRDDGGNREDPKVDEKYKEDLERDIHEKSEKLQRIQDDIIIGMASIVENRDRSTGGHIARTSDGVKIFVEHLRTKKAYKDLTSAAGDSIIKAAPLHDFGKIAIPDMILNKPGKFTDEEYDRMKTHAAKGAVVVGQILQNVEDIEFKKIAVNVAQYHHEKWDGSGYPAGLKGEEIPFEARVMALVDVFDALVSWRVYKEGMDYEQVFSIIRDCGGTHFDPELCREFLECRPKLEALYDSYASDEA